MFLCSNYEVVTLIQWHCMCTFTANLSPNFVNKGKKWFCFLSLVLVLSIIIPSGLILWLWVQSPSLYIFSIWLCYITLALIGSAFIDPGTCPRVFLQIFCRSYPNRTYGFSCPIGFRKFVVRVPVGHEYFP